MRHAFAWEPRVHRATATVFSRARGLVLDKVAGRAFHCSKRSGERCKQESSCCRFRIERPLLLRCAFASGLSRLALGESEMEAPTTSPATNWRQTEDGHGQVEPSGADAIEGMAVAAGTRVRRGKQSSLQCRAGRRVPRHPNQVACPALLVFARGTFQCGAHNGRRG